MTLKHFASLTALACATLAYAADRIECRVLVVDPQGAVVSGATVSVLSWNKDLQKLSSEQEQKTDLTGQTLLMLPPDKYEVLVRANGFKLERIHLDAVPGRDCSIQGALRLGSDDSPIAVTSPESYDPDLQLDGTRAVAPDLSGSRISEIPVKPFVLPKKRKFRR